MKSCKSLAILALAGVAFIILSVSFTSNDIASRAIIIGMGIDYIDDEFEVTAEIVSAGGGQDMQVGAFSKLIFARGDTIFRAVTEIYNKTGMLTSLGQSQILILGESAYTSDKMQHILSYFSMSEEYKDSSSLCCAEGSAKDIMQTQLPLSKSISFTLTQLLKDESNLVAVPSTTVSVFLQSTLQLSQDGYITLISCVLQPDAPDKDQKTQVSYMCDRMVHFKDYTMVDYVDSYNTVGFTLLDRKTIGQRYTIDSDNANDYNPEKMSIYVTSKKVDVSADKNATVPTVNIDMQVGVQSMRYSNIGKDGPLHPLVSHTLTDKMKEQAKSVILQQLESYLATQRDHNCDCVGIYKALEIAQGAKWEDLSKEMSMQDIVVNVSLKVRED